MPLVTPHCQHVAENVSTALISINMSPEEAGARIEPVGFAERLESMAALYLSDVSEAAALVGVSAASLLGV